jgi:predicted DNA-binding protein
MIVRSISLQKELNEKLQQYCQQTGRTISGFIALLIKNHLDREERTDGTEEEV